VHPLHPSLISTHALHDALPILQMISKSAGQNDMIGGQMLDIEAENREISFEDLEQIHSYKTGKLISAPVKAAAVIADADERTTRSEEHTSELQSRFDLVCGLPI